MKLREYFVFSSQPFSAYLTALPFYGLANRQNMPEIVSKQNEKLELSCKFFLFFNHLCSIIYFLNALDFILNRLQVT